MSKQLNERQFYENLISRLTVSEGGKVQISRGNMKEVVKLVATEIWSDPEAHTLLMRIGKKHYEKMHGRQ